MGIEDWSYLREVGLEDFFKESVAILNKIILSTNGTPPNYWDSFILLSTLVPLKGNFHKFSIISLDTFLVVVLGQ